MREKYEYLIIGAGISGIAMARLLQLSGVRSFAVREAAAEAGGLCRTRKIGGHYLDVGGGHFLCTKHEAVYDFIFAHCPRSEFNYYDRVSKIRIGGTEIDYPLESNIWQLATEECREFLLSIVRNGEARGLPAPSDFEGWLRWKLGDRVTDDYMIPYNRKIWGVEPSELDIDWLSKIPRLKVNEIVDSCLRRQATKNKMPSHEGFFYPRHGGFQTIIDALLAPVAGHVCYASPASRLEQEGDGILVDGKYLVRKIIVTVPWQTLGDSPMMPAEVKSAIGGLRHNSLQVSLHEEDYRTDAHWTYVPDENIAAHREFFIHNFAPHSDVRGLYRETNVKRWDCATPSLYSHCNQFAYPIPVLNWARTIQGVLDWGRQHNIHGLGRWGQWQYFNSDVCIHQAMRLAEELGHTSWKQNLGIDGRC